MRMNTRLYKMTLHAIVTDCGDTLLWGFRDGIAVPGPQFRNLLFAWHAPSCYGTNLELQQAGELTVTVLPAEMALAFFAEPPSMDILQWESGNDAAKELSEAAPLLYEEARAGRYLPSYDDFRNGKLQWTWEPDSKALDGLDRGNVGLRAAFSAAVFRERYGDETSLADLRREYPALFQGPEAATAATNALTEEEWLAALGWRPDTAPFRPALQLLEPDDERAEWLLRLVLQSKSDGAALVPIRLSADGHASGVWPGEWSPYIRERSPGWAARLATSLSGSGGMAEGGTLFAEPLNDEAAWRFLTADSRRLLSEGWNVMLPAWWEAASKRKPRLRARVAAEAGGRGGSLFGLNALVDFDWRVAIGDADLNEAEFAELLSRKERLIRFRGEWVYLDPALLTQIQRLIESVNPEEGLSLQDVLQLHLLSETEQEKSVNKGRTASEGDAEDEERVKLEVELNAHLIALLRKLAQPSELQLLPTPEGLRAELRGYQREGFTWLSFLRSFGLGACLADDMGLGKTVQFIAYLLHHQAESETPALLVCPTSVLGNWQKELARFAPDLKVLLHYGKGRLNGEALTSVAKDADIVITSYATALLDQESLQAIE